MSKFIDLTGYRFGRLTVLERDTSIVGRAHWICKCDCGTVKSVSGKNLRRGNTKSCGCLSREKRVATHRTHGLSRTKIYRTWQDMRKRCYVQSNNRYKSYGGRGIQVCDEWRESFTAFYEYVSKLEHYGEDGYSLDRINVDGNYEPNNVRWATAIEQANNKTTSCFIDVGSGRQMTLAQIVRATSAALGTIQDRVRNGWQPEDILQAPCDKHDRAPRFDVGNGQKMTANEIAKVTGLALSSVYRRIHRGLTGVKLLQPAGTK